MARPVVTLADLTGVSPIPWRSAFIAQDLSVRIPINDPNGTMPLAYALGAWVDAKASVIYSRTTDPASETPDELEFAQAAAEELAYAARELAAHHNDTLSCQLGLSAREIARVRAWAAGTLDALDAAVNAAQAAGRALSRTDLTGGPMASTLPAMVAAGVPCPAVTVPDDPSADGTDD